MLELLGQFEERSQFFNLFNYITFRTGGAMFTAMLIAFIMGAPFIAWLRKKQGKGQPIREDGPQGHLLTKKGTPTMGGLIILIGVMISSLLWSDWSNAYVWAVLLVTVGFGLIGFIDDYAKVTKQHHGGLSAKLRIKDKPQRQRKLRIADRNGFAVADEIAYCGECVDIQRAAVRIYQL